MKKAPQVYQRFVKMIVQVVGTHGFTFAHKFTDALLRKLDESFFTNPVSLMRAGEHNVILDMIQRQQAATATIDPRVAPRQTYGPVTTPLNGPGAGLIFDHGTKRPRRCAYATTRRRSRTARRASCRATRAARRAGACSRTKTSSACGRRALSEAGGR